MASRGGTNGKRILSWIAAVILIAAGAVAIGWFAGAALIDFWAPASADYPIEEEGSEGLPEGTDPDAAAGADTATDSGVQDDALPASQGAEVTGAEAGTVDTSTSPFASPPWANNLVIKPLDEGAEATAEAASEQIDIQLVTEEQPSDTTAAVDLPQAGQGADAELQPTVPAISAGTAAGQQSTSTLYKVRVGPYPTKEEAAAAAGKLTELQYPTIVVSSGPFYVQIGAFTVRANAENLLKKVQASGFSAVIVN